MARYLISFLNRSYTKPHRTFSVTTDDGVLIRGVHLGNRGGVLLIYCHGMFSSKNFRRIPPFLERLAEDYDAMAFDFRGHGESTGQCTFGREETRDLKAVMDYGRQLGYQKMVAIGASMGGATVLRTFGKYGGLDGVVTIGAFADAEHLGLWLTRVGVRFFFQTEAGRTLARWTRGIRIGTLAPMRQPLAFAHHIHVPLLVIHGQWDPLIEPAQALRIVEQAPEPKRVVLVPRGGHVMSLLNGRTRQIIVEWLQQEVGVEPAPNSWIQPASSGLDG